MAYAAKARTTRPAKTPPAMAPVLDGFRIALSLERGITVGKGVEEEVAEGAEEERERRVEVAKAVAAELTEVEEGRRVVERRVEEVDEGSGAAATIAGRSPSEFLRGEQRSVGSPPASQAQLTRTPRALDRHSAALPPPRRA